MLISSLKLCVNSQLKLRKLEFLNKFKRWKRRRSKKFGPDLSWLTSSFAATEVSHQLKQVFKFIDADGDGKISPLELSEVLLSLGHTRSLATKEAECIVREMDCDGDGFVDLDEFMNVMGTSTSTSDESEGAGAGAGAGGSSLDKEDELFQAFLIFDADKNGVISAAELQRVLISLGCQNSSLKECKKMIKGVDKDGDGFVNFQDFKSMMRAGCCRSSSS